MNWNEFLRPERKKFILPIFLIAVFVYLLYYFYALGSFADRYYCDAFSFLDFSIQATEKGSYTVDGAIAINGTNLTIPPAVLDRWNRTYSDLSADRIQAPINARAEWATYFIWKIDPLLPLGCEATSRPDVCSYYYMREDTYTCITGVMRKHVETKELLDRWFSYKSISIPLLLANIIILFTEGYLLSCILVAGFRKISENQKLLAFLAACIIILIMAVVLGAVLRDVL